MALRARDVMQTSVATVQADTPLSHVGRFFVETGIHGAPVVDETDRLLGVISVTDLIRAVEETHESGAGAAIYFRDLLEYSGPDWTSAPQDFQDRLEQVTAGEVMQPDVITVTEDTSVPEIAKLMRENGIHRVIVVRDGQLVGLVSALDLVGLLEA
ncbi:MAG TPA: CBS domain-containing protein [Myxococcota bacterium]